MFGFSRPLRSSDNTEGISQTWKSSIHTEYLNLVGFSEEDLCCIVKKKGNLWILENEMLSTHPRPEALSSCHIFQNELQNDCSLLGSRDSKSLLHGINF